MTTYAFYELSHAAGVPHALHICDKSYKNDKQAIKAAQKVKRAHFIKVTDVNGVNGFYELQNTETGAEFVKVDETRQNSPYFKYLFS